MSAYCKNTFETAIVLVYYIEPSPVSAYSTSSFCLFAHPESIIIQVVVEWQQINRSKEER